MDAFTAQQTTELMSRIGTKKATMRMDKLFINSVMAGPLLGFGCAIALSVNSSPWFQTNAPGLIKMVAALLFPIGLVMIVLTGADLFTSNVMYMTTALLHRRITVLDLVKNWVISYLGNLAGMLFFMAIITGYGNTFGDAGYKTEVFKFAGTKMVTPAWHQIMLRGIGANWLVCMAVYLSISAREVVSKITAIWWPTATFVALGLDHVIANMYFIPTAIFYGDPSIGVGYYIWKSMIPTCIGNILGGAVFVALPYWYLYLTDGEVEVGFNIGGQNSVVGDLAGPGTKSSNKPSVLHGQQLPEEQAANHLPNSSGQLQSGLSKELSADKYGRPRQAVADEERDSNTSEKTAI